MTARAPYFAVSLEGQDVTPWVSSVQVVEDDRQADSFKLTVPDPRMVLADALLEGSRAEIDLGYTDQDQHALMLRGTVTKVELSYPENGVPAVTISGEDKSIEMGLEERTVLWQRTTVGTVVSRIASRYGFARVEVGLRPDPKITAEHQDGKTDLAFLQDLAKNYHAKCFVELDEGDREVLYFVPERRVVTLRRPETLVLRYRQGPGSTLRSFSPSFDASYLDRLREVNDVDDQGDPVKTRDDPPVEVTVWELPADLDARVGGADRTRLHTLYSTGVGRRRDLQTKLVARRPAPGRVARTQGDLDATTDVAESRRLGMSATGATIGTIWLRAKSTVRIAGVHERFIGDWYVTKVTHTVDTGGYRTEFSCVR
jgi:phage protein D